VGLPEGISYLLDHSGVNTEMFLHPGVNFNVAVTALAILIVAGAAAGLIPARKAVSVKPIDALRFEL
jgi:putative ABC transport system permease protein